MFKCSRVMISEDQKGDQGGGPKNGQNFGWGKTRIFKRAAQKWPKLNMG